MLNSKFLFEASKFLSTVKPDSFFQLTQMKTLETLENNLTKPTEIFSFEKPLQLEKGDRMLGLTI